MKKMSETIVFFGSGPVAAASLQLLAKDFAIEAVVTKPAPEGHRGEVPVLETAEMLGLPVLTASNKKELDAVFVDQPCTSTVAVLIDFGIIVSQAVIDYFPKGIVNSHFSLLPDLRGADPITFAILSGQGETGVSLMLLVAAMDEGPLLTQAPFKLKPTMTTPELTDALIQLSADALSEYLPGYMAGSVSPKPQDPSKPVSYSHKLQKEDGVLDYTKSATRLEREVRAFAGWPKSRTNLNGLDVVITRAHVVDIQGKPGTWAIKDKSPIVHCQEQTLVIDSLKPAGKKEMTGEGFLAGYKKFLS
jgi:methionyl-tRNA formyltransferase